MINQYWHCQLQGFWTILCKEIRRFMRIFIQTLLPTPITAFLYLMIFTQAFGDSHPHYSVFLSPGLILMGMMNNAFSNTVSSFFGAKFQKHIEELLVSPLNPLVIVIGFIMGGVVRGLLIGSGIFIVSQLFDPYTVCHPVMTVSLSLLVCWLFASLGLLNALFARKFDDISLIPTFIITPLIYLGGVFYSLSQVKGWLYTITYYNPLYTLIAVFRASMLAQVVLWPMQTIFFSLFLLNSMLLCVNYLLVSSRTGMGFS